MTDTYASNTYHDQEITITLDREEAQRIVDRWIDEEDNLRAFHLALLCQEGLRGTLIKRLVLAADEASITIVINDRIMAVLDAFRQEA